MPKGAERVLGERDEGRAFPRTPGSPADGKGGQSVVRQGLERRGPRTVSANLTGHHGVNLR